MKMADHSARLSWLQALLTSVFGVRTLNDIAAVTGILPGLATWLTSRYYRRREDRRREELHALKRRYFSAQGHDDEPPE